MVAFKTLDQMDVAGKRVLVRVDLNVPMQNGMVSDATRIKRLVPTIRHLTDAGARVILLSHFGRPNGKPDPAQSLRPLVAALSQALDGKPVAFAEDCIGPKAAAIIATLAPGDVALLENIRFHPGEEANCPDFAASLAAFGDVYINDAFSAAHRAHASTEALARLLPVAAGYLMQAEIEALGAAFEQPARPMAAIVGGSKVSTKLTLLNSLVRKVDVLVIGGAMANTMLVAQGIAVGTSLVETDMIDTAHRIFATAEAARCRIVLPIDGVVAATLAPHVATRIVDIHAIPSDAMILDVGPATVDMILAAIAPCKTLVWNGPLGAFEIPPFDQATVTLARKVADRVADGSLIATAGGGDTVSAMAHAGVDQRLSYLSTAGGAFLEWLEGRTLPGVAALTRT